MIGDYSFDEPLSPGSRVVFCDMAIYSMVKNNTFNGMNLPAIYLKKQDGSIQLVRKFGYGGILKPVFPNAEARFIGGPGAADTPVCLRSDKTLSAES